MITKLTSSPARFTKVSCPGKKDTEMFSWEIRGGPDVSLHMTAICPAVRSQRALVFPLDVYQSKQFTITFMSMSRSIVDALDCVKENL